MSIDDKVKYIKFDRIGDCDTNLKIGDLGTVKETGIGKNKDVVAVKFDKKLIVTEKKNGNLQTDGTYLLWEKQLIKV